MDIKKRIIDVNAEKGCVEAVEKFKEAGLFDPGYFTHYAREKISGSGVISAMFEMSEDDGTFMTYDYRADGSPGRPEGPVIYTIEWSGDTPADEIAQYEYFRKTIEEVAVYIGKDRAVPMDSLPAPLAAFASIYLLPAEAWYTDEEVKAANTDLDLIDVGYHYDDERLAELRLYEEAVERDARSRVGSGPLAHSFMRHCQRLAILYSTGAPEFIIRNEENRLAYTMVIHYRGERVVV